MLNSKEDEQVLRRLQRLKNDIVGAAQYLQLDKCASKLAKIQQSVAAQSDRKRRKQWQSMVQTCEELMREKTKYFKKRILQQLNSPPKEDTPQGKSLKGSKSMENFQLNKLLSPVKQHKQAVREDNSLWNDKTQVIGQRLEREVESLREELQFYRKKVQKLEGHRVGSTVRVEERDALMEQQFAYRLREKGLEMEEMRGRLRYYEEKNQDLKNRLLNQQKRQDDYVNGLKGHIQRLGADLDTITRQNRRLQDELAKSQNQYETVKTEARHFFQQSEALQREKKQMQSLQILRMKEPTVKRELEALAQQQKFMRDMQALLQTEKQEKNLLIQRIQRLEHQLKQLDNQQTDLQKENGRLAEALEIRNDEVEQLKKQILISIEERRQCQMQVENANQRFMNAEQELQNYRHRRNQQLQRKSTNLRQIREILECK